MKINKIKELQLTPLQTTPKLIQHFVSLEGEGGTIGRSALYIRTSTCSLRCNFCDTKFSIEGNSKYNIVDMTSNEYVELLKQTYSDKQRENISNLSITGGEPLLNLNHIQDMILRTKEAFPNITQIIFETNGTMLSEKENCFTLIDQVGCLVPEIKFMLSISPKLSGSTSYSNIMSNSDVLEIYKKVILNYQCILDAHFDLQLKFVHSDKLLPENQTLIDYVLSIPKPIHKNQILIMPFTPNDPLGKDKEVWQESKNAAANFAMRNFFRYSPRVHIDRELD